MVGICKKYIWFLITPIRAFQKMEVNLKIMVTVYKTSFGIPNNQTILEKKKLAHLGALSATLPLKQGINHTNLVNLSIQV